MKSLIPIVILLLSGCAANPEAIARRERQQEAESAFARQCELAKMSVYCEGRGSHRGCSCASIDDLYRMAMGKLPRF